MVSKSILRGKRLVSAGNAAGVVYGMITVGALMAAESGRHESYVDAIGSAVFATLLYWLAHAYADLLGRRLDTGERLTLRSAECTHSATAARKEQTTMPPISSSQIMLGSAEPT